MASHVVPENPGVASWLSHEGLTKFEGGLGYELVSPSAVLRQGSPFGEGRRGVEVGQVALKRPAERSFNGRQRREAPGSTRA